MRYLLNYLPPRLRRVEEFREIMEAEQPEIGALNKEIERWRQNQFAETADRDGLARLERAWGITDFSGGSLDERRFALKAQMLEKRPSTMRGLAKRLAELCGAEDYTLSVDPATYRLTVRLALASKRNLEAAERMILGVKPAVITLDIDLLYNRHSMLAPFTHGGLEALKHKAIRDEVLEEI